MGTLVSHRRGISCLLLVIFAFILPFITKNAYLLHLLNIGLIYFIYTLGFALIWSTGRLTFGHAGFAAIGAYTTAVMTVRLGLPFWLSFPVSGITGGLAGLAIGYLIVRRSGGTFIVLTWCIAEVIRLIIHNQVSVLGGYYGIRGIPAPEPIRIPYLLTIEFVSKVQYYYLILFILLVMMVFCWRLYSSRIGRVFGAMTSSDRLSQSIGINLVHHRTIAFVIATTFAGLAGSVYASYLATITPEFFTIWESLEIEMYGIVGGLGNLLSGPIVGVLFLTAMVEISRAIKGFEPMIYAIALMVVIFFLPGGIASLPRVFRAWMAKLLIITRGKSYGTT